MKIKAGLEQDYVDYCFDNSHDAYSARIVSYGEDWANLMEQRLLLNIPVAESAKACASAADTDGITGFMYGAAVSALAHFWEHGEELRLWHNPDLAGEAAGAKANETGKVLNPALITIGGEKV